MTAMHECWCTPSVAWQSVSADGQAHSLVRLACILTDHVLHCVSMCAWEYPLYEVCACLETLSQGTFPGCSVVGKAEMIAR